MRRAAMFALPLLSGFIRLASAAPLAADTPQSASFGATFTAPKDWSVAADPARVEMAAPEGNLHIAIVDAGAAVDAAAAVTAAWRLEKPDEKHRLKVTAPQAARDGWDLEERFEYETSPDEHLVVRAVAYRHGARWTVLLIDGSEQTGEKREAAAILISQSLRPAGYQRESFAGRTPHPLDAARIAALRAFVAGGMTKLRVPGVGLALIEHGKVVYAGGIGVRELGKPQKIDAHTLFMIASNTKGLTTLLLARLVDEGKLAWDEPVTRAYPGFRLGDEATTRQVEIRHLICACTGIPRRDLELVFNDGRDRPAADTFKELASTQPTSKFGEVFQYSNVMASAAGYVGGHIEFPDKELGAAYDAAMQRDIFAPLGMTDTTFKYGRALAGDHASPHADTIDGKQVVADMGPNYSFLPFRPAGGAWSSVDDMAKYVQDELTPGRLPNGRQFISAKNVLARRAPSVPLGEDASYGMGLMTDHKFGVTVVHHGGDLLGFHSDWFAIPDADVGAVILTNGDNGDALRGPFGRRLLEVLYDGKPDAEKLLDANAAGVDAEIAKERAFLTVPADPAQAANLAARYTNPSLGHINVSRASGRVMFDFGGWASEMATRKNDDGTISFVTTEPGVSGAAFVIAQSGGKPALKVHDGQHSYIYVASP